MTEKKTGVVKWFNTSKGYGFITDADGKEVFVHYLDIQSDGFKNLLDGQSVEFFVEDGAKGQRAKEVVVKA